MVDFQRPCGSTIAQGKAVLCLRNAGTGRRADRNPGNSGRADDERGSPSRTFGVRDASRVGPDDESADVPGRPPCVAGGRDGPAQDPVRAHAGEHLDRQVFGHERKAVSYRTADGEPLCSSCGATHRPCAQYGRTLRIQAMAPNGDELCPTCWRHHPDSPAVLNPHTDDAPWAERSAPQLLHEHRTLGRRPLDLHRPCGTTCWKPCWSVARPGRGGFHGPSSWWAWKSPMVVTSRLCGVPTGSWERYSGVGAPERGAVASRLPVCPLLTIICPQPSARNTRSRGTIAGAARLTGVAGRSAGDGLLPTGGRQDAQSSRPRSTSSMTPS